MNENNFQLESMLETEEAQEKKQANSRQRLMWKKREWVNNAILRGCECFSSNALPHLQLTDPAWMKVVGAPPPQRRGSKLSVDQGFIHTNEQNGPKAQMGQSSASLQFFNSKEVPGALQLSICRAFCYGRDTWRVQLVWDNIK